MAISDELAYRSEIYYALALDPIHVGAGGYQLGGTDNSIVRDPGTNLPKIPGTSLAGAARSYVGISFPDESCATKVKRGEIASCGKPDCPTCIPFGFTRGDERGFQGMTQFFDARIIFFPVYSMLGPVWITSPGVMKDLVSAGALSEEDLSPKLKDDSSQIQTNLKSGKLNLGWLMLDVAEKSDFLMGNGKKALTDEGLPEVILNKLVLVPDRLLGQLINSNLEVRTSTAIDPKTGAAREGALFTYEAIPRSTVLWFGVVYKNPRNFKLEGEVIDHDIEWVEEKVTKGLSCMEELGVGGMVTRGMGRIRVLNM